MLSEVKTIFIYGGLYCDFMQINILVSLNLCI